MYGFNEYASWGDVHMCLSMAVYYKAANQEKITTFLYLGNDEKVLIYKESNDK